MGIKNECNCDVKYRQSVSLTGGRSVSFFIVTICNKCGKTIFKKKFLCGDSRDDDFLKESDVQ